MKKKSELKKTFTPPKMSDESAAPKAKGVRAKLPSAAKPAILSKAKTKVKPVAKPVVKKTKARKKPETPARPKHQSTRHPRKPVASPLSGLWSTGVIGGVMVVTAALWSALRPAQAPLAGSVPTIADQVSEPAIRTPAAADPVAPPNPAPTPSVTPPSPHALYEDTSMRPSAELARAFDEAAHLPLSDRVAWWSETLSKAPDARRALSSLGAGPSIADVAPLLPERFDCTTYVETLLALARSERPGLFFQKLIEVRYRDSSPGYLTRNHFPEADWIPNNVRAGQLADITAEVAGHWSYQPEVATKTIDRGKWLATHRPAGVSRELASADGERERWSTPVEVRLPFVPTAQIENAARWIPSGAVINFIHTNSLKLPVLISHQGIAVRSGGVLYLRHASPGGRVRTVVLGDYLRQAAGIVGININQLRG